MTEPKGDQIDIAYFMPFLEHQASQAAFVLEIGVGWGNGSTRAFTRGLKRSVLPEKLHIGVDLNPGLPNPELGFEAPDTDYWHMFLGLSESKETMVRVWNYCGGRKADIIFIDTDHRKAQLEIELRVWDIFANEKTLWIFHDTWMMGRYNPMVEAIQEYCVKHPEWEFEEFSRESNGLSFMRWRDAKKKLGLNLGCGTRVFQSSPAMKWINIDIQEGPGVDCVMDWRNLDQLSYKVDTIVAHQTWEHEGCGEQPVRACYECLNIGGSLIVSVPDLRKLAKLWLSGEMSTQLFMTNVYGPYDGTLASRHFWGFDSESLREALRTMPWKDVKEFDYRTIPGADIARDDRWILCLEAVK